MSEMAAANELAQYVFGAVTNNLENTQSGFALISLSQETLLLLTEVFQQ